MNEFDWIGKNNKAIAPLRVSSSGQDGNTSWLTQKSDCEDYCRRKGLELVDAIQIVESASKSDLRKKYNEALKNARRLKVQHILFHKFDRETRNLTDNEINEVLVRKGEIVIHYVADDKILHKNSPDTDFFNRDIQAVINKNYSRDLSSKVRRATGSKAQSGWSPACTPPHGYVNQMPKNDKGLDRRRGSIIVPDANKAVVCRVQREFEIRAQSPTPSLRDVRNQIIAEGLVPASEIQKYHIGSIDRRLKNIFYDGRFMWSGVEYVGKHERIITASLFKRVQETFGSQTPSRKSTRAIFGSSFLKCADPDCGCVITFDPKTKMIKSTGEKKTFRYYRCSNGKRVHEKNKSIAEDSIMTQLGKAVSEISIQEAFRKDLMRAVNETLVKARRAVKDDLDRFKAALVEVDARENQTYDLFAAKVIELDVYNSQRKRLQSERTRYADLMTHAQLRISDGALETVESIIELANNAESLWVHMTTDERKQLLTKLLSNRWLDGVTVRYEIVKPLRLLVEMKEDQNWRRG